MVAINELFFLIRCGKCVRESNDSNEDGLNECGKCPGEPCCNDNELDDCGNCPLKNTKMKCDATKMMKIVDSSVQDLVCDRSIVVVRLKCPKSNPNCFKNVENVTCLLSDNPNEVWSVSVCCTINVGSELLMLISHDYVTFSLYNAGHSI